MSVLLAVYKVLKAVAKVTFTLIGAFLGVFLGLGLLVSCVFLIIGFFTPSFNANNDSAQSYDFDYKSNANVIVLDPLGTITETYFPEKQNAQKLLQKFNVIENTISLAKITTTLEHIAADPKIKAIIFDYNNVSFENDVVKEKIMYSLRTLKDSGKKIITHLNSIDFEKYMPASVADVIVVEELAYQRLEGYSVVPTLYYKDFYERYGVDVFSNHVGKYKSAIEPYTRDKSSRDAKENVTQILKEFWDRYIVHIAYNRSLRPEEIHRYIDTYDTLFSTYEGNMAAAAVDVGLATHVYAGGISETEFIQNIVEEITFLDSKLVKFANFENYAKNRDNAYYLEDIKNYNIAAVPLKGELEQGYSTSRILGSKSVVLLLRALKQDKNIKALVLWVNSPGGDVIASFEIERELLAFSKDREAYVPIVVSMGELAASGGYLISLPADYIVAEPFTITGSIGVYSLHYSFNNILNNLGIGVDSYESTWLDNSEYYLSIPTQRQQNLKQTIVEDIYKKFVQAVADSRNMTWNEVDTIAQGKIYTGKQALAVNLVDKVGSLDDAITMAAERAGIASEDIKMTYRVPEQVSQDFGNFLLQRIKIYLSAGVQNVLQSFTKIYSRM